MQVTNILDWLSVAALLIGAWLWWRASGVKLPAAPVTGGWDAPLTPLEPTFEKLNEQGRFNRYGAIATAIGIFLQAVSIACKQWSP